MSHYKYSFTEVLLQGNIQEVLNPTTKVSMYTSNNLLGVLLWSSLVDKIVTCLLKRSYVHNISYVSRQKVYNRSC